MEKPIKTLIAILITATITTTLTAFIIRQKETLLLVQPTSGFKLLEIPNLDYTENGYATVSLQLMTAVWESTEGSSIESANRLIEIVNEISESKYKETDMLNKDKFIEMVSLINMKLNPELDIVEAIKMFNNGEATTVNCLNTLSAYAKAMTEEVLRLHHIMEKTTKAKPPVKTYATKDEHAIAEITMYLNSILKKNEISKENGEIVFVKIVDFGREANVRYVDACVGLSGTQGGAIQYIESMDAYYGRFRVDFLSNGQVKIDKTNPDVSRMLLAIKRLGDLERLRN